MATGFSFSNGTWSWSSATVSMSIKPSSGTVTLKNINTGITTSVNMTGVSTASLQTPIGTLSLASNGTGHVKVTGGSNYFSADLSYSLLGGSVNINNLTLKAEVPSTGLLAYINDKSSCTATLTPLFGSDGFGGFTGTANCKITAFGLVDWTSGTYQGTMNGGNFLNMVPGMKAAEDMRDAPQNLQRIIDEQTSYNGAKVMLASYINTEGYSGGDGTLDIHPGGGYFLNGGTTSYRQWTDSFVGGIPAMDPLMANMASAGIIGWVGDSGGQGPSGYSGRPAFTNDDTYNWNMRALLAGQRSPDSAILSAAGDSDFQKMIYFQAMTAATQATSAGYLFGGGPGS